MGFDTFMSQDDCYCTADILSHQNVLLVSILCFIYQSVLTVTVAVDI